MDNLAIVTTSYRNDYDWCRILCQSIDRFVPENICHYLLVENRDVNLFKSFENNRRKVISQNKFIPWWMIRFPLKFKGHNFWISPFTIPVRGWILQQIAKLSMFEELNEDVFLCLDSEAFFCRPFSPGSLFREGKVILVSHDEPWDYENAKVYYRSAVDLLGLEPGSGPKKRYMSVQFVFRKELLKKLAEKLNQRSWLANWKMPLFNKIRFSEYTLYGMFVEDFLGIENTQHFAHEEFLIRYIGPKSYSHDINKLEKLLLDFEPQPDEVGILLQRGRAKKKGISPAASQYERLVHQLWNRLNNQ
jgi:hypothetical protein